MVEVDRDVGGIGPAQDAQRQAGMAAAGFTALLVSSLSVLRLATNLKSMTETLGVRRGSTRRRALPFSSGSTRPTALAAFGRGRDHRHRRGAAAIEILVHRVERRLVAGVGMDRRHRSRDRADRIVQHPWRPAPGSWSCEALETMM